jgi:hypothetical protein
MLKRGVPFLGAERTQTTAAGTSCSPSLAMP